MHSIRTKITALAILVVALCVLAIGGIGSFFLRSEVDRYTAEQMRLLCETRRSGIDDYLDSIEQSVETVSRYAQEDLERRGTADLGEHLLRIEGVFHSVASNSNGALTYYYRIAPEVSRENTGYWYYRSGGEFLSAPLTDIEAYTPDKVSRVGWYYIPRERGIPSWLDPYFNENLGYKMISYVAPMYYEGEFLGVIGMDVEFSTLVEQIRDITLFQTGYAFLADQAGRVIYHPSLAEGTDLSTVTTGLTGEGQEQLLRYRGQDQEMRAAWSTLSNGMRLFVTARESEISGGWARMLYMILAAGGVILAVLAPAAAILCRRITEPLSRLTEAARRLDAGDYDLTLDYQGSDEVGILTGAFRQLTDHLKSYISDLNSRAYVDALTGVRNKGAFELFTRSMEEERAETPPEDRTGYGVVMFDLNDLKRINDEFGHDKGDLYLKNACDLICRVYRHSPVFRLGGDEFVAVLHGEDYGLRDRLLEIFDQRCRETAALAGRPWERVDAARGMAVFDPLFDGGVEDVLRRADENMYENKRDIKEQRGEGGWRT